MDIITAVYAANKAKADLENSGQVGRMGTEKNYFMPERTDSGGRFNGSRPLLVEGETYFVNYDGVEYICKCIKTIDPNDDEQSWVHLGNFYGYMEQDSGMALGEPTDEPFAIYDFWLNSDLLGQDVRFMDGQVHTYSVYQKVEAPIPIDPKFLPGVCLPVVEIADTANITAEESAQLQAAADMNVPCVIRYNFDMDGTTLQISLLFCYMPTACTYVATVPGMTSTVVFRGSDGVWELM